MAAPSVPCLNKKRREKLAGRKRRGEGILVRIHENVERTAINLHSATALDET